MVGDWDNAELSRSAASLGWRLRSSRVGAQSQSLGTLYIDEHVRLYHGQLTELPRRPANQFSMHVHPELAGAKRL
jgi:hypothetical protein